MIRRFPRVLPAGFQARIGVVIVLAWVAIGLIGPLVMPGDPNDEELADALLPPAWVASGAMTHPFGTDQLGQDILLRVIYGARSALVLGSVSVACAAAIGVCLGLLAAELGGWVDDVIMRLADIQLSIPFILLAITVLVLLGGSNANVVLVLILSGWVTYARVMRGEVLQLRGSNFVEAARAVGASRLRIIRRHLLPNTLGLVIVVATLQLADVILLASVLSFLGVGLGPPAVDWGAMLSDGRDYITSAWWISTLPGAAITLVLLGVNIVGDWLRDVLDPRHRTRA